MDRERITISIKKEVLKMVDEVIDGIDLRNRSHAIESIVLGALNNNAPVKAIVLLGGDSALKSVTRAIDFIKNLSAFGIKEVIVATGFLGDKVKEKIIQAKIENISIKFSDKGEGSGGALLANKKELSSSLFIVYADSTNIDLDLDQLIKYHKDHNAIATLSTNDLSSFRGIYVMSTTVFQQIPKGYSMLEEDLVPKLSRSGDLVIYPIIS